MSEASPPPKKSKTGCILLTILAVFLGGGVLVVFVCCGGPMAMLGVIGVGMKQQQADAEKKVQEELADKTLPAKQIDFAKTVESFYAAYQSAPNELKKSALRVDRRQAISKVLEKNEISGWVGTLTNMGTNSEGKAHVEVKLAGSKSISVKTWNNAASDLADSTLIANDNPLFKTISELKTGDKVIFSGIFLSGDKDFIRESSITENGSMLDPAFIVRFTEIGKAK